ncbi:MAG: cation transporter [Oscillospiraceae bacterium]|nr:cation transporter [Oscillospiraceae bacterium]
MQQDREHVIVRTSVIGIAANVLLAAGKAIAGLLANSIAVTLDAVNNLTDALSSVVTIIGTKIGGRKPDKEHPLGHGRAEYLSAMAVAVLVLYAGISALIESVKKIITPEIPAYSTLTLAVLGAAIVVKLLLGQYVKRVGKRVNSGALAASGADALFDALLSLSVLLSAVVYLIWQINLEAYVGVLISAFILKAGVEMLLEAYNDIVGKRVEREFYDAVRGTICKDPSVLGAYDLILHSYGPDRYFGSVHVEIPDTMTAEEIDRMERRIADAVYCEHGVVMTGIGIYTANTTDDEVKALRAEVTRIVMAHEGVLQMHGFYASAAEKQLRFDVILDFEVPDRKALFAAIHDEVQAAYPDYTVTMTMDIDV